MSAVGRRAFIVSYRRGSNSQNERYVILEVEGVSSGAEAARFIGRKVVYLLPNGEKVQGRVVRVHGRGGRLIARFRRPLPGQALGKTALVI
ncbi:MAG: 50S ribosomal protein L35ae [Thermofilaceae archaeon]